MKFTANDILLLLSFSMFASATALEKNLRGRNLNNDDTQDQAPRLNAKRLLDDSSRSLQDGCLSDSMLDSAKILQFGYKLNNQTYTPVSKHAGDRPIFDADKILAYVNDNFISEDVGETISVIEDKVSSFARDMELKMQLEASYGSNWLGGSLTISAAAELGLSKAKDTENYYAQNRKFYTFGTVQLPFTSENKEQIQALMDEYTLQELKDITTLARADELVREIGIGYLHKSYFGATFVMTTIIEKEKWMYKSLVASSISANYENFVGNAAKGEASTSITIEKNGKRARTEVNLRVEGGNPTLLENVSEWKKSAEDRPVITEYTIYPIYELLSDSGIEKEAHDLLKEAVKRKIADSDYGNIFADPSEHWKTLYRDSKHGVKSSWSSSFSEENRGFSDDLKHPIYGMACSGEMCDNKRLIVAKRGNNDAVTPDTANMYWTSWFSEEARNLRKCPDGKVVNQIQCRKAHCDDVRLQCSPMADGYRVRADDTMETNFFSEEEGQEYCDDGYYVYGLQCGGNSCDNIKLFCVRVEYMG